MCKWALGKDSWKTILYSHRSGMQWSACLEGRSAPVKCISVQSAGRTQQTGHAGSSHSVIIVAFTSDSPAAWQWWQLHYCLWLPSHSSTNIFYRCCLENNVWRVWVLSGEAAALLQLPAAKKSTLLWFIVPYQKGVILVTSTKTL